MSSHVRKKMFHSHTLLRYSPNIFCANFNTLLSLKPKNSDFLDLIFEFTHLNAILILKNYYNTFMLVYPFLKKIRLQRFVPKIILHTSVFHLQNIS